MPGVWRRGCWTLTGLLACACNFNSGGNGGGMPGLGGSESSGGVVGDGPGEGDDEGGPGGDGSPGPMPTTGSPPTTTFDPDSGGGGSESTGGNGSDTGTPIDCGVPQVLTVNADAATVTSPMVKDVSPTEGTYAFSPASMSGEVGFEFDVDCPGQYVVWGRVWDANPGINNGDPDSYVLDPATGESWFYGCQTIGQPGASWYWLPVIHGQAGALCDSYPRLTVDLAPGPVELRLTNRESMNGFGDFAAIARVIITNDVDFVPSATD